MLVFPVFPLSPLGYADNDRCVMITLNSKNCTKTTTIIFIIGILFFSTACWPDTDAVCHAGAGMCSNNLLYRCEDDYDHTDASWNYTNDCSVFGAVCREHGKRRASCVFPDLRCPKGVESVCLGNEIHKCVGSYIRISVEEECDEFCVVSKPSDGGDKQGYCSVSATPCPEQTRSFCENNEILTCNIDGYAEEIESCTDRGLHCTEAVDAVGWTHAACGLDVTCGPEELARCVDNALYDCSEFDQPVFLQDCQAEEAHCTAFEDRQDAFCHSDALWSPVGNRPLSWTFIKGGTFDFGEYNETFGTKPVKVTVPDFEILKTEVTVAQYKKCVDEGACTQPFTNTESIDCWVGSRPCREDFAPNALCNWGTGREDHPVNCIIWEQAKRFCEWAGGRLPTETQWEFAARSRGAAAEELPESTCQSVVMDDGSPGCGKRTTWPVCSRPTGNTNEGLCDMCGNVAEFVLDLFRTSHQDPPSDGSAWLESSTHPSLRVHRGGGFKSHSSGDSAFTRHSSQLKQPDFDVGFRCAR